MSNFGTENSGILMSGALNSGTSNLMSGALKSGISNLTSGTLKSGISNLTSGAGGVETLKKNPGEKYPNCATI